MERDLARGAPTRPADSSGSNQSKEPGADPESARAAASRELTGGISEAAWLTGLLGLSPDVVTVMSPDGTLLYVSRRPAGRDPREVLGHNAAEYLPEDRREPWRRAIAQVIETGQPHHFEMQSVGDMWWDTRIAPIKNAAGETEYLLSIGTDVTAQKRVEEALALKEQQLELALEASGMGQWRWDVGGETVSWDVRTRKLMEWPDQAEGPSYAAFLARVHPDDRERVQEHMARSLRTARYAEMECRMLLPSGACRWTLSRGKVLTDESGRSVGMIGGMLDITATKEKDAGLQRAQKLEAIGQLAGGVAHDFNNLLVAIVGSIDLARREENPAAREKLLQESLEASRRAAKLTRQLLVFSRRQPLHESMLDLNWLLRDTVQLLTRLIPESIHLELVEGKELPRFLGDRGQIEQVILNLCINARDAMPKGGCLVLETEEVLLNGLFCETHPWARPGRYVMLSVSDSGIGMSPRTLERVSEPFFTTKEQGTGLGLATAYGIIKQHGGLLHAYSELDQGSTFKVYLPVAERDAREPGPKPEAPAPGGSETILLAEDEESVRFVVSRILTHAGYNVLVATDGQHAVELFEQHAEQIDLVLIDAIMPRLNGTEAIARIRHVRPKVPAVVSTGYSDALPSFRDSGLKILQKPYEPDALLRVVRETLDR